MTHGITNTALSAVQQLPAHDAIGMKVLKTAMDTEANAAKQLIDGLPKPSTNASNPPNLGQQVDTTA